MGNEKILDCHEDCGKSISLDQRVIKGQTVELHAAGQHDRGLKERTSAEK